MRIFPLLAATLGALAAHAEPVPVTWTNATFNTDGSTIAASGAGSLARTTVEYGTCNAARTAIATKQGEISVAAPATTVTVALVVIQEYCLQAFHSNTYATVFTAGTLPGNSVRGSVALRTVLPPVPAPPSGLTTTGATPIAYTIKQTLGRVSLAAVAEMMPNTACNTTMGVRDEAHGELFVVPRERVARWYGNVQPVVIVAACGG